MKGLPYVRTVRSGRSLHLSVTPHTLAPPGHRRRRSQIQTCRALAHSGRSDSEHSTFGADLLSILPICSTVEGVQDCAQGYANMGSAEQELKQSRQGKESRPFIQAQQRTQHEIRCKDKLHTSIN